MGMDFEVSYVQSMPSVARTLLLLSADQNVELTAPSPAPCLLHTAMFSSMMTMGQTFEL